MIARCAAPGTMAISRIKESPEGAQYITPLARNDRVSCHCEAEDSPTKQLLEQGY